MKTYIEADCVRIIPDTVSEELHLQQLFCNPDRSTKTIEVDVSFSDYTKRPWIVSLRPLTPVATTVANTPKPNTKQIDETQH
jgi:hypothetical protein